MKKRIPYIIFTVLITMFIFHNSMQNAVDSTASSDIIIGIFGKILNLFKINTTRDQLVTPIRKLAHILEFLIQAVFIAKCFCGKYRKRIVYILFFGLLTACVDEFIQSFSYGRSAEVLDVFIDFFGTNMGMIIGGAFHMFRRRKRCRA